MRLWHGVNIIMIMSDDFWKKKPVEIIVWHDRKSSAKGILVINDWIHGACGGGTRVSLSTNQEELTHLAKIMQLKFSVFGPHIGGAKSGIIMDPNDPNKYAVLKRWFEYIKPLLNTSYGTASDLNTDFQTIQSILKSIDIPHPQYGIIQSIYNDSSKINQVIQRMKLLDQSLILDDGCDVRLCQMVTGYLIANLVKNYFGRAHSPLEGAEVVVQGVGTVGSAAAYYLHQMGAKIIGLMDVDSAIIDENGFSSASLTKLLKNFSIKKTFSSTSIINHDIFYQSLKKNAFPIFIPAAGSYLVNEKMAELLIEQSCKLIVSGSNIPFKNSTVLQKLKESMTIIDPYISSGGMACAFSLILNLENALQTPKDVLDAIKEKSMMLTQV